MGVIIYSYKLVLMFLVSLCMSSMLGRSLSSSSGELVWYIGGEDMFLCTALVRSS